MLDIDERIDKDLIHEAAVYPTSSELLGEMSEEALIEGRSSIGVSLFRG